MKIAIGSDHAGYAYKNIIKAFLEDQQFTIFDYGTDSEESTDYADFAHQVAVSISEANFDCGILICGSANGVAMTANKHHHIRAALCWNKEITSLARKHNNANIICLPARFISIEEAQEMVQIFLSTSFEGGRHARRVGKINIC